MTVTFKTFSNWIKYNMNPTKNRLWTQVHQKVGSSCSTCGKHHVILVTTQVIRHEWGKEWIVIKIVFRQWHCPLSHHDTSMDLVGNSGTHTSPIANSSHIIQHLDTPLALVLQCVTYKNLRSTWYMMPSSWRMLCHLLT